MWLLKVIACGWGLPLDKRGIIPMPDGGGMPDEAMPGLGLASTERVISPLICTAPKLGDWLMGTSFFTPLMAA